MQGRLSTRLRTALRMHFFTTFRSHDDVQLCKTSLRKNNRQASAQELFENILYPVQTVRTLLQPPSSRKVFLPPLPHSVLNWQKTDEPKLLQRSRLQRSRHQNRLWKRAVKGTLRTDRLPLPQGEDGTEAAEHASGNLRNKDIKSFQIHHKQKNNYQILFLMGYF